MPGMDVLQATAVGLVFVVAGAVKGITGMGLPTVAVSLLGLWMAPGEAAALLVVPALATNVAQCRGPHLRRLALMLWPAWAALALVTVLMPVTSAGSALPSPHVLLGGVLVLYGLWGLWRPRLPELPRARWVAPVAGAATGAMAAATAVFVVPLVPWLQCLRLGKAEMVQALGLSFTLATLALAVRLGAYGGGSPWSVQAGLALLAACAGLGFGARVRGRIGAAAFQRALFLVFAGLGLANLLRGG
jgi:hypothetical protein